MTDHENKLLSIAQELFLLGEKELSVTVLQEGVRKFPANLKLRLDLANAMWMSGAVRESLDVILRAAELAPDEPAIQHNIAFMANRLGLFELEAQGLASLLRSDRANADLHFRMAEALDRLGRFDGALTSYKQALALKPEDVKFHIHHGYALLRQGLWHEGWDEMGWYWRPEGLALFSKWGLETPCPLLQRGQRIDGSSILVTGWGGGGDLIMFTRMADKLMARGAARVTLHMTHNLSFFSRNRWKFPVRAHTTAADAFQLFAEHDTWVPAAHVPAILELGESEFSCDEPYFTADLHQRDMWRQKLAGRAGRKKVGLAWSGNPSNLYEHNRSIPTTQLVPLLELPGIDWYVVQRNERNGELQALSLPAVYDYSEMFEDFDGSAGLMSELDLIISVDSLPAHLAASLGQPVWLLLANAADWRWGVQGTTTSWYSNMRIYRQSTVGDWTGLLRRVANDLTQIGTGAHQPASS